MKRLTGRYLIVALFGFATCGQLCGPRTEPDCTKADALRDALNIKLAANGRAGYAFTVSGLNCSRSGAGGFARYDQDPPKTPFTENTPINIASVSKTVTAVALLYYLDNAGISVSTKIGNYLPQTWTAGAGVVDLTFSEVLSHQSGFRDPGSARAAVASGPTGARTYAYANVNYALLGVLLPIVSGHASRSTADADFPQAYVKAVNERIWSRIVSGTRGCQNDKSTGTLVYPNPPGTTNGLTFGDSTAGCAAGGWVASAHDLWVFLNALHHGDTLLTPSLRKKMYAAGDGTAKNRLGWSNWASKTDGGHAFLGKGGELPKGGATIWTGIFIFDDEYLVSVVSNSDTDVFYVAQNAYDAVFP